MTGDYDRPCQPFLDHGGQPRNRSRLSAAGRSVHRAGEAIVNLRHLDAYPEDSAEAIRLLSEAAGVDLRYSDDDIQQASRSGFMRVRFSAKVDAHTVIERIRDRYGVESVSPNTVFTIGSLTADPMSFGSVTADPMSFGAAYGADPMMFAYSSTARPAARPSILDSHPRQSEGPGSATVAILDTGIPADGALLPSDIDFPSTNGLVRDRADVNTDKFLDIAAGHATFIRTIIQRGSPAATVLVEGVIHNDGDGDEADIANALQRVFDAVADKSRLIVNLSFSGYYEDDVEPPMIAFWIRELVAAGAVIVAAAGNDGACRKKYPAAMPEVISVAALGPCGPAGFSNHGPWVEACAPGEDLVSEFFSQFDGAYEPIIADSVPDIDDFHGWAMWSGTSFATPAVVAALAELVETYDCPAQVAVHKLLRRPGLFRIPDYGVVVNRIF